MDQPLLWLLETSRGTQKPLSFPICLLPCYTDSLSHRHLLIHFHHPTFHICQTPLPHLKFFTQSTMAGCFVSEPMQRNMTTRKRKELDQVSDDFSGLSLSSPARKIRRLDAQLPPILEEEEVDFDPARNIEELENQERAIVLFNPAVNNPILHNPCNVSISLSPDLVSGFKDQFVRSSYQYGMKCDESGEEKDSRNQCTAVVPWVPRREDDRGEPMEMGAAEMEVEESSTPAPRAGGTRNVYGGGFLQWQQQHCMIPQHPQNTSSPITWFR